jgi:succinoglycan biosynthesis transport protein ExoP
MKWLIVATILVFVGVSAGVTLLLPETYRATAIIRVVPPERSTKDPYSQVQTSQVLARTYAELLKSPDLFERVAERGEYLVSPGALAGATTVSYVEGTDLIRVEVEGEDPRQASSLANLLASTFIEEKDARGGHSLALADPASPPAGPVSPSMPLNLALALLLGTGVAVGGSLLLNTFRGYVSSPEEFADLAGAPVMGSLPHLQTTAKGLRKSAAFEEAISTLRVNLDFALGDRADRRAVLITSASPGEGKTLLSSFLAASYARAGYECIIVDAALRKPQVHERFAIANLRGLSHVLAEGPERLDESISRPGHVPNLAVLTGGKVPSNPVDLLSSDRARRLIHDLRKRFHTVILDSPPASPLVDASVLGSLADGIVLVADARKTRRRDLLRAVNQLRGGKGRILGVVLNFVQEKGVAYYSYE